MLMEMILPIQGCDYRGRKYDIDQEFSAGDDCNKCTCKYDGQVTCTQKKCLQCKRKISFFEVLILYSKL